MQLQLIDVSCYRSWYIGTGLIERMGLLVVGPLVKRYIPTWCAFITPSSDYEGACSSSGPPHLYSLASPKSLLVIIGLLFLES